MTIKGMSPQFLVKDLEHSIAFYTRKLGFVLSDKSGTQPGIIFLR